MKYAKIISGKVNLIECDASFAASHPDIIQVPDNVHGGWIDNGDGTYSPPPEPEANKVDISVLIDVMTTTELIALYNLAGTDVRAEILKDFMLSKRIISKDRALTILDYLVNQGIFTEARKDEIINRAKKV